MKIAPCVFCEDGGQPFTHFNRHLQLSVTVRCESCQAQGPHVKLQPEIFIKPTHKAALEEAKTAAIKLWNTRQLPRVS